MKSYRVELTQAAENDIIDIARYIAQNLYDREAADRLVDEFYTTIIRLIDMPKRRQLIVDYGHIIPEGIHRVGVKNYDIYHSCHDEDGIVYIRRVLYSKREWQDLI